jgi:N-acetylmuramic acid 6-phosphate etherase
VIALDTGAEILSGSTRLKAGSATKAALNAITTAAMVRAGKVFGNLMVDLRQGSAKLRDRAQRITAQATGLDHEAAGAALERAGGSVKLAIVMARRGVDRAIAERLLLRAGGKVRGAIDSGAE